MSKALIFCNKTEEVPDVVSFLRENGIDSEGFSSSFHQEQRTSLLSRFTRIDGDVRFLVCTQVLGRGHDFANLQYVINYDMPHKMVEYVHRIGRTGRGGRKGL